MSTKQLNKLNRVAATACLGILLSAVSAHAQTIEWLDVSEATTPASIGTNTIARRENQITFDASIDRQYVRYNGNCQSDVLYRLQIGALDDNDQPTGVKPYPNERWFTANEFQSALLAAACEVSE